MTWEERRDLALYRLMITLPPGIVARLGEYLGQRLGRRAHPAADARVAAALRTLRPDLGQDAASLERAQRRLWAHVGSTYAEFCVLERLVAQGRIDTPEPATMQAALADGRPVIFVYVHTGNWEAIGHLLGREAPGRGCAIANALPSNRVKALIAQRHRDACPCAVVTADGQVWRRVLRHLGKAGNFLFISVDEHSAGGAWLPAFGRPIDVHGNPGKIVRLAARTGSLIVPCYCERVPGPRFVVRFLDPIGFARGGCELAQADVVEHVARLDRQFEPVVRRLLDQWFGLLELRP